MNHNELSSLQKEIIKRKLLGVDNIANKGIAYDNNIGYPVTFDTNNWIERDKDKYVYYDESLDLELEAEKISTMQSNKTGETINIYASPIIDRKILPKNFNPTHKLITDMQHFSECILRLPIIYKTKLNDDTFEFKELCKVDKPKQEELIKGLSEYKEFTDFIGYTLSKFGIPHLKISSQVTFIENSENSLLSDVLYTKLIKNDFQYKQDILAHLFDMAKLGVEGYVLIITDDEEEMLKHLVSIQGTFKEKPNTKNNLLFQANYISNNVYIHSEKIENKSASELHYIGINDYI